ncbi:MAG: hypothetical protein A2Y10_04990 [Planctomycetes bacterium GWF2_41_51]|nr:MAG: hypothetical protein A2Y10_04990 [Planctomycetes bacterium GWF2_41_51]HBG25580.1 hypothetical protein [Phycisphaerales bacterium]
MKLKISYLAVLLFISSISLAYGPHLIPQGQPVVDGVVGSAEWDGVVWQTADKAYNGSAPTDILYAKWAATWSPATNLIYVAVVTFDSERILNSWTGADQQDYVAICVDAGDSNAIGQLGVNDKMQQWNIGANGSGGAWVVLGNGTAIPAGEIAAYAVSVSGASVSYEVAVKPYTSYVPGGSQTIKTLAIDNLVGLDVVVCSRNSAGVFAMLANDQNVDKFDNAGKLIDHKLSLNGECVELEAGDLDQDCHVNFADFAILAESWLVDTTTIPNTPTIGTPVFTGQWGGGWFFKWPRSYSGVAGSSVSTTFKGTSIRIWGNTYSNGGDGEIFIDGISQGVRSFLGYNNEQISYDFDGLTDTDHVIQLKVATPANGNVLFLAFLPTNPGTWEITGSWGSSGENPYTKIFIWTNGAGNTWSSTFTGTEVTFVASSWPDSGIAGISIDGGAEEMVDLYQPGTPNGSKFEWTKTGLSAGSHSIVIRCTGTNSGTGSTGNAISVVEIIPSN